MTLTSVTQIVSAAHRA